MARTTFSGPVKSENGFEGDITGNITGNVTGNVAGVITLPLSTIAALPAAAAGNKGQCRAVSNAAGGAAATMVVSNGAAWIDLITGVAVSAT